MSAEGSASESHGADAGDNTNAGFRNPDSEETFIPPHKRKTNVGFHKPGESGKDAAAVTGDSPTLLRNAVAAAPAPLGFLKPPQEADEIGRLANYRVLSHLGSGGMGMVFLAEDIVLRRKVALKIMRPDLQDPGEGWQRMLREARSMASIKHEHLITVFQAGQEGENFYMAMEMLEGESLHARLLREPRIEPPEILRMGREIASGLSAIHKNNIIHRDIKPSNIWLEAPKAHVRILDFGLARIAAQNASVNLTQNGTVVGTPAFMSPEQARNEEIDFRSDLFSLGCVLYCMCTGTRPFKGDTVIAQLMALAVDDPQPPHLSNAAIPESLSALVMQLLSKKPDLRPASAEVVMEEIKKIERDGTSIIPKRPNPPASTSNVPASQTNFPVALKIAAAVLIIAALAWIFRPPPHDVENTQAVNANRKSDLPEKRPPPRPRPVRDDFEGPPPPDGPPERAGFQRDSRGGGEPAPRAVAEKLQSHLNRAAKPEAISALKVPNGECFSVFFPENSGKQSKGFRPPGAFNVFGINGMNSPHAIGMHPDPTGPARLELKLDGAFSRFAAAVSQNDGLPPAPNPFVFQISGDGKLLWKSKEVAGQADTDFCDVDVKGVKVLTLQVSPTGEPRANHAIWFEPILEK